MTRRLRLAPAVPLLWAACSAPIRGNPESPRQWADPQIGPPEVSIGSEAAAIDGAAQVRAGARALWRPLADSSMSFAIDAAGVRGRDWWTGLEASARWQGTASVRPWVEAGAGIGSGAGASRAVFVALGAEDRHFGFTVRSVRFEETDLLEPGQTVTTPDVQSTWDDYTDAEILGRFIAGRASLEVVGGMRLSEIDSRSPWASAGIAVPLSGRVELRAGGGSRPDRPERGERGGPFVSIGVAFSPNAPVPAMLPPRPPGPGPLEAAADPGGGWTVAIRIPAARSVEINGDITDWSPLRLDPAPDDPARWTARLSADAGVYLVALRIDAGTWRPPPGLPIVPDGFGGQAGLLELLNR